VTARRATIARAVTVDGIGLHLGQPCRLTFHPAPAGTGRVFVRSDRPGRPRLPALASHAEPAERRTQVGRGADAVHTVEHALAAVAALELDDLVIELDAPEPPVLDGSSAGFVEALRGAGRCDRDLPPPELRLREVVRLEDGVSRYEAHPADELALRVVIDFPHPLVGRQEIALEITPASFAAELAAARTFGFVHEVEALHAMGLALGGHGERPRARREGVVETRCVADEFVRHRRRLRRRSAGGGRVRARRRRSGRAQWPLRWCARCWRMRGEGTGG
jgi:UDP-3-O-acyl N-acetylglucosamine deacetylase